MPRRIITILLAMVCCGLWVVTTAAQTAEAVAQTEQALPHTPPRLSLLDGQVSFWRPGAEDWVEARINTALAPGDTLYVGPGGGLEIQIGGGAFLRAADDTQISLEYQDAGLIQLKMTMGLAALDLSTLDPGLAVVVETPNAAFTIQHDGYYRLEVNETRTTLVTRRGGQAAAVLANGETVPIVSDEAVTVAGTEHPKVTATGTPASDAWDAWNHARTDFHLKAESARYVSPGTYGLGDLDAHGTWRSVPTYGTVWVPRTVPAGWVPYSTGTWIRDPYYGWTWVDSAPWGWAPFHHGRWVFVHNVWCWAPGPIVLRPVYSPALVAFYGQPGVRVSVAAGGPLVGWVALGWGEPLIPWWGRPGFIHRPYWGGWTGPRVINNVTIHHTTVVNVRTITTYRNSRVPNAIVVVDERHFGHGAVIRTRPARADAQRLRPVHTTPRVTPSPAHFVPTTARGARPPEARFHRPVVESHVRTRPTTTTRTAPERLTTGPGPSSPSREAPRVLENRRTAPSQRPSQSTGDRTEPAYRSGPSERDSGNRPRPAQVIEPRRPSRPVPPEVAPLPRATPQDRPEHRPRIQGQGVAAPRPAQGSQSPAVETQRRPATPVAPAPPAATTPGFRQTPAQGRFQTPAQTPQQEAPTPRGVAPAPTGRSAGPQERMVPRSGNRPGDAPSRGRDTTARPSR